jgi:hypothetical protein
MLVRSWPDGTMQSPLVSILVFDILKKTTVETDTVVEW